MCVVRAQRSHDDDHHHDDDGDDDDGRCEHTNEIGSVQAIALPLTAPILSKQ